MVPAMGGITTCVVDHQQASIGKLQGGKVAANSL